MAGERSPIAGALRMGAAALLLAMAFALSLVAALAAHLDMAVTRRSLRRLGNAILADALAGELVIGDIDRLSPSEVRLRSFRAAVGGREVLLVEDVRLQGAWLRSALGVLFRGQGTIVLPHLRVERAELVIEPGDDGELTLVRAFSSREKPPEPEEPPAPPEPSKIGLALRVIELAAVEVSGSLAEGLPLDATVSQLLGRLETGAEGVAVDVARSSLRERAMLGTEAGGTVDFHLRAAPPSPEGEPRVALWGSFGGHLGELELHAKARYAGGRVEAELELPRVGSRELAPWVAGGPLERPVSARARIHGQAPLLQLDGDVAIPAVADSEAGALRMTGQLLLADEPMVEARLDIEHLDARVFGHTLPATDLNAALRLRGKLAGAESELRAQLEGSASRVADEPLPPLRGIVAVARAGIEAWLVVDEPGSRGDLHARFAADRGVEFAVRAEAADLAAVPRLRSLLGADAPRRGRLQMIAQGRLVGGELDVAADAGLSRMQAGGVSMDSGQVRARVRGPKDALRLDATASGSGLSAEGRRLERFTLSASGPATLPTVRAQLVDADERHIDARGVVDAKNKTVRGIQLDVEKSGVSLSGRIERIASVGSGVQIDGIELRGLGGASIDGALRIERGELVGKLTGSDVDLEPLSKLVGLPYRLRGKGAIDMDLERLPEGRRGHLRLRVDDAGMLVVSGVNVELDAKFDGATIKPRVKLQLVGESMGDRDAKDPCAGVIAELAVEEAAGELPGPLLDPRSWERLTGRAKLVARKLELRCLADVWDTFDPSEPLPLERIEGVVDGTAEIERTEPEGYPSVPSITLRTRGLVLAMRRKGLDAPPPFSTDRLDVALRGSLDAGERQATIDLRVIDERAPGALPGSQLARLHGRMELDLDALLADDRKLARAALERARISIALETTRRPARAWQALPEPLRESLAGIDGEIDVDVFAEGTLHDPSVAVRARGWGLVPSREGRDDSWAFPVDVDVMANHFEGKSRVDATIRREGEVIASLEGTATGDLGATLRGQTPASPWRGSLTAQVRRLPLDALSPLAEARVSGEIDGDISVTDLGAQPIVRGRLAVKDLRVGRRFRVESARVQISPVPGEPGVVTLVADVAERCRDGRCGQARVTAYGTLAWDQGFIPRPDPEQPAAVYLVAKDLSLAVVRPLLRPHVSRLGGRVNGEARLAYREILDRDVAIDVDMRLEEGIVHIPVLGQEFYNVEARVVAAPNLVRIDDLRASAASGALSGKLVARLDGLDFKDLSAELHIPEDEKMPLRIQGASLGTASVDRMLVNVQRQPDEIDVVLSATGLRIEVPPSVTNDVQPLEDHRDVTISAAVAAPEEEDGDDGVTPINLTASVDDAELKTGQVRVAFATSRGAPIVYQAASEKLGGIIELTAGELNLLGHAFSIERGLVRLREEEPGNPYVSVTARWDAPDGTTVYCDYIGPLKPIDRDKIRFRSSPPLSEDEIIAQLLFGDPGAGVATGKSGDGSQNLGGRIAAQQVNDVLGEIVPGLSTSFGTTEDATSASVAYNFSDRVTAQATFESASGDRAAVGDETAQQTTDGSSTSSRNTKLSIDWRFARNWLLRGSIGLGDEPSSGLDVLWQYRY